MIKDNRIIFGFGSVIVGCSSSLRRATFQHMQPSQEVGADVTEDMLQDAELLEKIVFNHGDDMQDFIYILRNVNEENAIVEFRGYTFDFSEYNEKSVRMVREAFSRAFRGWQLALAC